MLKWLRDKLMKGDEETFNIGLERNTNFLEFAKSFSNNTDPIVKESAIKKPKEKTKELFVFKTAEPYRKDYSRLVYWCNPFEPINKGKLGTSQGWRKEERFKKYY